METNKIIVEIKDLNKLVDALEEIARVIQFK